MSRETLVRATTTDISIDGRTVEGMALYWNRPSNVTDDGGQTYYQESFRAKSVNKTLAEKARVPLPLGVFHPWQPGSLSNEAYFDEPVGYVRFAKSAEGLVFRANLFDTPLGNDTYDAVKSGGYGDVSIGFMPYQFERLGNIVVRTEIGLNELSICPTGSAQSYGHITNVGQPTPKLNRQQRQRIDLWRNP